MSSLKAKIRLSTALAFSATLGVTATTLLTPAVAVAESVTVEDFKYETPTIYYGEYASITPTFKGGDEGATTWSRNLPGQEGDIPSYVTLNAETGEVGIPNLDTNGNTAESFHVYAHRDGQDYKVPVKITPKHREKTLDYRFVPLMPFHANAVIPGPAVVLDKSQPAEKAKGTFKFDTESPLWRPELADQISIDSATGEITFTDAEFVKGLLDTDGQQFREQLRDTYSTNPLYYYVPVVADVEGLEGTRNIAVQIANTPKYRDVLPIGIDDVTLKPGESTTSELYIHASPDVMGNDDANIRPKEKFGWVDGVNTFKLQDMVLVDFLGLHYVAPEDFPDWITWNDETKTVTVNAPEDIAPGEYVYNFKYSYTADDKTFEQINSPEFQEQLKIRGSSVEIPEFLTVPFKVTISGPETVATSSSISYPDTDAVIGSDGTIDPVIEGEASDFAFDTESSNWDASVTEWSSIDPGKGTLTFMNLPALPEGKDAWLVPIKATVDEETVRATVRITPKSVESPAELPSLASPVTTNVTPVAAQPSADQGATSVVRQALANTGANVATLIALGLLAILAGAAFLLYRRRATN